MGTLVPSSKAPGGDIIWQFYYSATDLLPRSMMPQLVHTLMFNPIVLFKQCFDILNTLKCSRLALKYVTVASTKSLSICQLKKKRHVQNSALFYTALNCKSPAFWPIFGTALDNFFPLLPYFANFNYRRFLHCFLGGAKISGRYYASAWTPTFRISMADMANIATSPSIWYFLYYSFPKSLSYLIKSTWIPR